MQRPGNTKSSISFPSGKQISRFFLADEFMSMITNSNDHAASWFLQHAVLSEKCSSGEQDAGTNPKQLFHI
jgi:hypothetical protein